MLFYDHMLSNQPLENKEVFLKIMKWCEKSPSMKNLPRPVKIIFGQYVCLWGHHHLPFSAQVIRDCLKDKDTTLLWDEKHIQEHKARLRSTTFRNNEMYALHCELHDALENKERQMSGEEVKPVKEAQSATETPSLADKIPRMGGR